MMLLVAVAGGLLISVGLTSIAGFLFFVPPFHMYRHLKETYKLGRFSAMMRAIALMTFALVAAAMFLAAAIAIGVVDLGARRGGTADASRLGPLGLRDRGACGRDRWPR